MATIKNIPISVEDALNNSIEPYIPGAGPTTDTALRAKEVSLRDDKLADYSITFNDIDDAVLYHFRNIIKPYVIEDETRFDVPVVYANPERWKSSQEDGGLRDKDGKVLFPVIAIKKDNIEKDPELGNKLDANKVQNYNIFQQKYTNKNRYDSFPQGTNRIPVKSFSMIPLPDYYKINYTCGIYVNNTRSMNTILEAILYSSRSYWGDLDKYRFMVVVGDIPITQEINVGENRRIYAEFSLALNGYIIPETLNRFMSTQRRFLSKSQIIFTETV